VRRSNLIQQLERALASTEAQGPLSGAEGLQRSLSLSHPLRILLAEDNSVNQRVAQLFLHKLGYRADVVANGIEAIEAVERQPYDVVLMDIQMPEMDGMQATRAIKQRLPAAKCPHIIAMTANALAADRDRCLEAGMADHIPKPLELEVLREALLRAPSPGAAEEP
jgi:CheY-like chemotaxis protein